ncbi:MAG: hypothetical protein HQK96_09465 [Nitrospirae bacterium]|nr:hypothetical protein [Nitrospirota bacterium]
MKIKKLSETEILFKADKVLRDALGKVPFIDIISSERGKPLGKFKVDLFVNLIIDGNKKQSLIVEVKYNGQPRMARDAVNQLFRYREVCPESYLIFMADYISPQAAEICRSDGVGYIDVVGNVFLSIGHIYIEQTGKPNPFSRKRDIVSLVSQRSSRVTRVLLNNPWRFWKTQELADEAKVSLGQISNVNKFLLDRDWVTKGKGFLLTQPWLLLDEFAKAYTYRKNEVWNYYSSMSISEIETTIADICGTKGIENAMTGFSGAARLAPVVHHNHTMCYVNNIEDVVLAMNLKEVESGANVTLLAPYDEGVYYNTQVVEGIKIVSPIQIFLDVRGFKGGGEEVADTILRDVIKPKWATVEK